MHNKPTHTHTHSPDEAEGRVGDEKFDETLELAEGGAGGGWRVGGEEVGERIIRIQKEKKERARQMKGRRRV